MKRSGQCSSSLSRVVAAAGVVAMAAMPGVAHAGGFELPDNGAEAIGRGGAFTAKADSPLALEYNVAGLARQRGTRLLIDANLNIYNVAFTRAGNYPGTNDASQPWAGKPYPTVNDGNQVFPVPFLGLTTDFGYFKHWTFGFAIFAPHAAGSHNYGVTNQAQSEVATVKLADGTIAPSPSRYDITRTNVLVIFPTLGVGYSPIKYLDIGVALQLVYGNFSLANANITNVGKGACGGAEDTPKCDAYGAVNSTGLTWGAIISLMAHPTPYLDIGVTYRPQIDLHTGIGDDWVVGTAIGKASGTIAAQLPDQFKGSLSIPTTPIAFNEMFPHQLRLALRYVSRYADGTERFDVEADGIYENWSSTVDRWGRSFDSYNTPTNPNRAEFYRNDQIYSPDFQNPLAPSQNNGTLKVQLAHNFQDTFGVRVGGAYNHRVNDWSRLIVRGGFYYDSSSTRPEDTRLDFNTLEKYALTAGLGYKYKGFTINIAYAYIYSPERIVTNSRVHPVSSLDGTAHPTNDDGSLQDAIFATGVGNGSYKPMNHILSLGLTFNFAEFKTKTLMAN